MDGRINWIDSAKGLGIILVVMSHTPMDPTLKAFLFAFHMPLFFYLSGAVFRPRDISVWSFLKKKARSLLLPYFLFSAVTYLFWFFVLRHFSFTPGENVNPVNPFVGIFLSTPENYQLTYNPAIWFLTCLFIVELLFFLYHRLSGGKFIALFLVATGMLGYASTAFEFALPWNGFVALTAIVFYGLGYLTKHYWKELSWGKVIPISGILFLFTFYIQSLNTERIDMRGNILGDGSLFYLGAIAGIAAFLILIIKFQHSNALLFLGQNSIVILLVHMPILNLVRAAMHYGAGVDLSAANTFPWTLFFTVTTVLLTIPFIYFFNKHPWFLGKIPPNQSNTEKQKPIIHMQKNAVSR